MIPRSQRHCIFPATVLGDGVCTVHGGAYAYTADIDEVCDKSPLYEPEEDEDTDDEEVNP